MSLFGHNSPGSIHMPLEVQSENDTAADAVVPTQNSMLLRGWGHPEV